MKTRGWEGWLVASLLADAVTTLFTVVTNMLARQGSQCCTLPSLQAP
jgi:hypothetical protein